MGQRSVSTVLNGDKRPSVDQTLISFTPEPAAKPKKTKNPLPSLPTIHILPESGSSGIPIFKKKNFYSPEKFSHGTQFLEGLVSWFQMEFSLYKFFGDELSFHPQS